MKNTSGLQDRYKVYTLKGCVYLIPPQSVGKTPAETWCFSKEKGAVLPAPCFLDFSVLFSGICQFSLR